jgi:hypothetical protein
VLQRVPRGSAFYSRREVFMIKLYLIDYLKVTYGDPLDGDLAPAQRAAALGFRRLIEESLYWATVCTRWFEPAGWVVLKAAFFADLPTPEVVCADACARHFETGNAWPRQGTPQPGRYLRDRVRRSERPRGVSSRKTVFPGRKTNFPRHYWVRVPRQLALGAGRLAA